VGMPTQKFARNKSSWPTFADEGSKAATGRIIFFDLLEPPY